MRIIFTPTASKRCFQKIVMQCTRPRHLTQSSSHSTRLSACYEYVRFTLHTLVRNAYVIDRKQLCWFQYSAGKIIKTSSCRWWLSLQQYLLLALTPRRNTKLCENDFQWKRNCVVYMLWERECYGNENEVYSVPRVVFPQFRTPLPCK